MRAHLIVVEQILLQFVPELRQGGERGAVDHQQNRSTFPLVLGPGMFDRFKRVRVFGARGREFGSIVR